MPLRALALSLCLWCALSAGAADAAAPLRLSGEARADAAYLVSDGADSFVSASSIRLDAVGGYRDSAKVEASVVGALAHLDGETRPAADIRKLYVSVFTEFADISAGRMIVNYGRGTVFSPVDLFSSADLSDPAASVGRTGTDALRVLLPFGDFSGMELVSAFSERPRDATAGGRVYGNIAGWDLAFSAFRDGGAFFGIDLKGDAVAGVSAEAAARVEERGTRFRLMAGLDYSIGGEWLFDLEYLENIDVGSPERVDAFGAGRSAFLSVAWLPDQLSVLGARAVATFAGGQPSWTASLSASRSIARGATLSLYASYLSAPSSLSAGSRLSVSF